MSIAAIVPSSQTLGFNTAIAAEVAVTDPSTGGTSVMTGALDYAAPLPLLSLVTAPTGTIFAGDTTAVSFAVTAVAGDGTTPMANQSVSFTASGGAVQFGACGTASCTVMTDGSGTSTTVTPLGAGVRNEHSGNADGVVYSRDASVDGGGDMEDW